MNEVILHGVLKDKFGESFALDVRDPAEAFRALDCQLPDFRAITIAENFVMVRELANGDLAITEDLLFIGMSHTRLHFIPMIEGAANKKGVGKLLVGVALVAGSFFIPGSIGLVASLSLKGATLGLGLALGFGGAALLLSPTPKVNDTDSYNSYLYQGDTRTGQQNLAIPLHFGRVRAKVLPVSSQIVVNQIGISSGGSYSNEPGGVGGGGGYADQNRNPASLANYL